MKHESTKYLFIFLVLVIIDQISKYLIRSQGGFYICNRGIAFGFELSPIFFWATWLIIISIVGFQILNFKFLIFNKFSINKFLNFKLLGLLLILSGAISNIIDRIYLDCIIDFIDLKFWPVFNLADSFIVLGVIMLLLRHFKKSKV